MRSEADLGGGQFLILSKEEETSRLQVHPQTLQRCHPLGHGKAGQHIHAENAVEVAERHADAPLDLSELAADNAVMEVPENYGTAISRESRQDARHVDAITHALRRMREEFPKARHILVGHSNGGISAAMQSVLEKPPVDAIAFSAPNNSAFPMR